MIHLTVVKSHEHSSVPTGSSFSCARPRGVLGRSGEADIVIPEATVSRSHVEFVLEGVTLRLRNLSRRGPTVVNGQILAFEESVETPLDGVRLQVGGLLLEGNLIEETYEYVGPPLGAPAAAAPAVTAPLLTWRWEFGRAMIWFGGRRLDLFPTAARALAALLENPGEAVDHDSILDMADTEASTGQLMTYVRQSLAAALEAEPSLRTSLVDRIARTTAGASRSELLAMDTTALMRTLIQSRRGLGYILNLQAEDVQERHAES